MADPVTTFKLFYIGVLIANPPIVGGRTLAPPTEASSDITYTFTQPAEPCEGSACRPDIFRFDKNPDSCWVYDNVSLENVEEVPKFFYRPVDTSEALLIGALGSVNGYVFVFRAHVSSRCGPTS